MHGEYELLPDLLVLLSAENIYRVKEDPAFFAVVLLGSKNKMCAALHCNKRLAIFPSPAGMSLTKLSLAGNY